MTRAGQTVGVSFVVTVGGDGDTHNNNNDRGDGGDSDGFSVQEELSVLPVNAHVTAYIGTASI